MDLVQMVLAKADPRIVKLYDDMLVPEDLRYGRSPMQRASATPS